MQIPFSDAVILYLYGLLWWYKDKDNHSSYFTAQCVIGERSVTLYYISCWLHILLIALLYCNPLMLYFCQSYMSEAEKYSSGENEAYFIRPWTRFPAFCKWQEFPTCGCRDRYKWTAGVLSVRRKMKNRSRRINKINSWL